MADLSTVRVIALTDEAAAPAAGQYMLVDSSDGTAKMELVKILQNEAPEFDATAAYSAGAYVLHDGALYQFTADHAAGAWAGTDAEAVTIGAELAAINADISAAQTALETKAETDGYYEEMTVGDAEQLVATQYVEDSEPYLFRTSGGTADIGNREYDKIVGGSLAWNQLIQNGDFASDTGWDVQHGSISISDGIATLTGNSNYARIKRTSAYMPAVVSGHKYLISATMKKNMSLSGEGKSLNFSFGGKALALTWGTEVDTWKTYTNIFTPTQASSSSDYLYIADAQLKYESGYEAQIKNVMFIDLTQMFGSTIADYVYSLETGTAGAGVAWFKKLFPESYYAYNAGELKHVSGLTSHDTVGFNQWDEEWELGGIAGDTGVAYTSTTRMRSKNYIDIVGGEQYYFKAPSVINFAWYDADKVYISGTNSATQNLERTAPDNARYLKFSVVGTTYNNDICINISWSGYRNGEYEPYVKHSYPLDSDLILRGIPKLDASNNLYYDGDTYEADGTVNRRYGIVDLGTLDWYSGYGGYVATVSGIKRTLNSTSANMICTAYPTVAYTGSGDKSICLIESTDYVRIKNTDYSTVAELKTSLSGVYLCYELATPTTETADSFQSPQIVDDFGTEEYVLASGTFPVSVGHDTKYPPNLRDKLQHLPSLADNDGTFLITQADRQMTLTPYAAPTGLPTAPTTDGTYVLKATVSSGTTTYTWEAES